MKPYQNKDTLAALIDEGLTGPQMELRLGVSRSVLGYWLRKHQLSIPRRGNLYGEFGASPPKYTDRECRKHGVVRHRLSKSHDRRWYRCITCSNEYSNNRKRKAKARAIEYLGGQCVWCGYNKSQWALDLHHRSRWLKSFSIGRSLSSNWTKLKRELDKCDLVCKNCHSEIEEALYEGQLVGDYIAGRFHETPKEESPAVQKLATVGA